MVSSENIADLAFRQNPRALAYDRLVAANVCPTIEHKTKVKPQGMACIARVSQHNGKAEDTMAGCVAVYETPGDLGLGNDIL